MSLYDLWNHFWDWAELHELSPNAICLLGAIAQCANRCGWPEWVSLPRLKLQALCHLPQASFFRARKELAEAGLIEIEEGSRPVAARYKLVDPGPVWYGGERREDVPVEAAPVCEEPAPADELWAAYGDGITEETEPEPVPYWEALPEVYQDEAASVSDQYQNQAPHDNVTGAVSDTVSESVSETLSGSLSEPYQKGPEIDNLYKIKTKTEKKTKTKTSLYTLSPSLSPPDQQRFEQFWSAYPRKSGKNEAEGVWGRIEMDELLFKKIIQAVRTQSLWDQWQRDGGRFIPHPARWLERRQWEDQDIILPRKPGKYDRVPRN